MSSNVFGGNLTRYLGRGGAGKIYANSSSVLQIANRCGGVAELAAGTYTVPTLESGQEMFWFWVKATGAVTITGVGTLSTNESRMVAMTGSGWAFVGGDASNIDIADAASLTSAATVEDALIYLMQDAFVIRVPTTAFVDADGDPLAKFSAAPAPGFALLNSEAFGLKWGANATHSVAMSSILLPRSISGDGGTLTMNILASKSGATVGDATTFTVTAFENATGALHDAGSNIGGVSSAMTGNATAKTVQHETLDITLPGTAERTSLTFTIQPTNGTLGTDDVIVESVFFTYAP
jgi:hypothetical protein